MTLNEVARADFDDCRGQAFEIECGGKSVTAELTAVTSLGFTSIGSGHQSSRESFSLLFHGPKQYRYPQCIYKVSHPRLGSLEMFLVPLGPDARGMKLEAVFNFT